MGSRSRMLFRSERQHSVEPSSVDVETLIKSIAETKKQREIDDAKKAEKEREESKKIDDGIIDTTKEMNAEI
ncbi:hypothetical protein Hanom_Chr00s000009g01616571 [Helianthus anomalus]